MVAEENGVGRDDVSSEMEEAVKQIEESDNDPTRDSLSSQGEIASREDSRSKRWSRVPKALAKNEPASNSGGASRVKSDNQSSTKLQFKSSVNVQERAHKTDTTMTPKIISDNTPDNTNVPSGPSAEGSEEMDDKPTEEVKEIDVLDEVHNCDQFIRTDDEMVDTEENSIGNDLAMAHHKIDELESRIEKLEEELREVATLEILLYSVAPEHGSSAYKVHTPAGQLSKLFIHASKYWTPERKATVARNTISGLLLVSKSCGNDVPRLTFWLSNTIVLREIIHQTFGNGSQSNAARRSTKANGSAKGADEISASMKIKTESGCQQARNFKFMQFENDWHDPHTFTTALEEVESWMFSQIMEIVWHKTLTSYMQSPAKVMNTPRGLKNLSGPALGDRLQGSFSINLWKNAFQDVFSQLCPLRSGGRECGCLPIVGSLVMEKCVSRLDVAMFNAILRESAHQLPTDPISDPIADPRVLPIPAGDLSFGSGAQLKNAIGNWSRWLTDLFVMDVEDSRKDDSDVTEDNDMGEGNAELKPFHLLNELSDLLMLPKDMLLETDMRKEVCPSICLPLIIRILCNFTLDEFCPDPVPVFVLDELNTESMLQRKLSTISFPYMAAPVEYTPPSPTVVAMKVGDYHLKSELNGRASIVQKNGYTSDEDLDSPLTSIMNQALPASPDPSNGSKQESWQPNLRYKLLREVWSA